MMMSELQTCSVYSMTSDFNIAGFVLSAPDFAFLCPLFLFEEELALITLKQVTNLAGHSM